MVVVVLLTAMMLDLKDARNKTQREHAELVMNIRTEHRLQRIILQPGRMVLFHVTMAFCGPFGVLLRGLMTVLLATPKLKQRQFFFIVMRKVEAAFP